MKFNIVKKSIFGTKLMWLPSSYDAIKKPQSYRIPSYSMFKIKEVENGFVLTCNGETVTPTLKALEPYGNIVIADLASKGKISINLEYGYITPEYVDRCGGFESNYIIGKDGKIYSVSSHNIATFTGHTACMEPNGYVGVYPVYIDRRSMIVCKTENETFEVRDTDNLKLVINAEFDSKDIDLVCFKYDRDGNFVNVFKHNETQYLADGNGNVLKTYPSDYELNKPEDKSIIENVAEYIEKVAGIKVETPNFETGEILETNNSEVADKLPSEEMDAID